MQFNWHGRKDQWENIQPVIGKEVCAIWDQMITSKPSTHTPVSISAGEGHNKKKMSDTVCMKMFDSKVNPVLCNPFYAHSLLFLQRLLHQVTHTKLQNGSKSTWKRIVWNNFHKLWLSCKDMDYESMDCDVLYHLVYVLCTVTCCWWFQQWQLEGVVIALTIPLLMAHVHRDRIKPHLAF